MTQEIPAVDASILILGYNSLDYLDACLRSVPASATRHNVEVLFVNNGTDGSEAFLATDYPAVRVLESRGNVGFGEANNRMADHARGRWLILLNPDTELYPEAIDTLIEAGEANPDFWLLGGVSVNADGTFQQTTYPELPSFQSLTRSLFGRAGRQLAFSPDAPVQEVNAVFGGFLLASRERWIQLGGFDDSYFLYGEDIDLSRRTAKAGGRLGLVQASRVFHDFGSGNPFSPTRKRFQSAGNAHYFLQHYSPPMAWGAIGLLWAGHVVRFVAGTILSGWKARYGAMSRCYAPTALKPWIWATGFNAPGADPRRASPDRARD